jgi:hypothetical protein
MRCLTADGLFAACYLLRITILYEALLRSPLSIQRRNSIELRDCELEQGDALLGGVRVVFEVVREQQCSCARCNGVEPLPPIIVYKPTYTITTLIICPSTLTPLTYFGTPTPFCSTVGPSLII